MTRALCVFALACVLSCGAAFAQAPKPGNVTAGTMVPLLVSSTLTGQLAAISATTIYTPAAAGTFRVCIALALTTNGTGGNIGVFVVANTALGASGANQVPVSNIPALSNGNGGGCIVVRAGAGGALQYLTTFNAVTGSPVYTIDVTVEQLK